MKTPQQFLNDCIAAYLAYARGCGFASNAIDTTPALVKAALTVGSAIFNDANLQKAANDPIAFKRKVVVAVGSCVYAGIVFACKYRKDPALLNDPGLVAKIVEDGPLDMARDTLKRYFGFEQGAERGYITGLTDKWADVCGGYLALEWQQRKAYIAASMIAAFRLGVTMVMDKAKIPDGSNFIFGDEPKTPAAPAPVKPTEENTPAETPAKPANDEATPAPVEVNPTPDANGTSANDTTPATPETVQPVQYELKIGKVAQFVFPVLFDERKVTAEDVAFLMSTAATKRFKCAGNIVLKEVVTGDLEEDAKDHAGRKRFYTKFTLPFDGKQYLLTSQWFAGGLANLMAWFDEHGVPEARVVEICKATGKLKPAKAPPVGTTGAVNSTGTDSTGTDSSYGEAADENKQESPPVAPPAPSPAPVAGRTATPPPLPEQPSPSPSPVNSTPIEYKITIDAKCSKCLCLAQVQSHIPVVSQVKLINGTGIPVQDLVCRISCTENFFLPKNVQVPLVPPNYECYVGNVDLKCDKMLLSDISETKEGTIKIEVLKDDKVVASKDYPTHAMAKELFVWGNDDILFAAYASRDAISIAHLQSHVAEQMETMTGSPAIHSYQGGDPGAIMEHCFNLCRAIYNAIQSQGISYSEPKAADGLGGQKVRLADDVFIEKQATCLDSAVLFAAVMESCGLNPVLFLKNNHAFVGCHLLDYHFSKVVMGSQDPRDAKADKRDIEEIKDAIRTANINTVGRFIAIETTCIGMKRPDGAGGMRDMTFDEALRLGRAEVEEFLTFEEDSSDYFESAVDVKLARRRGVLPLEGSRNLTVESCPVKPVARFVKVVEETKLTIERFGGTGEGAADEKLPARVRHWAERLMQLSAFNPLLNRAKSPCLINIECADRDIAAFEDRLASAGGYYTFADWPTINKRNATRQEVEYANHNGGQLPPGSRARMIAAEFEKNCLCVAEKVGRGGKLRNKLSKRVRRKPQYVSDLTKLDALGLASAEETGAETLYAAIGSLEWESIDSKGASEICRAPILLMPIELEISAGAGGCRIRKSSGDSDTILNQSLVKLLETKNVYFDDFSAGLPVDDSGLDVMKILRALENRIFGRGNLKVIYDLCIGHFTFGNYAKWSDVHDHADQIEAHPLVRHLINRYGSYNDNIELVTTANINDYLDPADLYCPKPMDSTQLTAVINSSRGKSFLLDGPPGTGKSHTITNIIAHNLAKGKRILFVAQKETALNVVKERLDKVGLAPFCLQLYAEASDKAAVLRQFQDSIEVSLDHSPDEWKRCAEALKAYKGPLEEYVKELHRPLGNGLTPYRCLQSFFQHGRSQYARYIDAACCSESKEQLEQRRMAIGEFASTFTSIKADLEAIKKLPELKNARVSYAYTTDLVEACRNADATGERAASAVADLGDAWNIGGNPDIDSVRKLVTMIEALLETGYSLEQIPSQYYELDVTSLREQLKADAARSDKYSDLSGKVRSLEGQLSAYDLEKCLSIECDARRHEIEQWSRKRLHLFGKNPLEMLDGYRKDGKAFKAAGEALAFLELVSKYQELKKAGNDGGSPECGGVQAMSSDARHSLQGKLATFRAFMAAVEKAEEFLPEEFFAQNAIADIRNALKDLVSSQRLIGTKISYSALRARIDACKMGEFAKLVEDGVIAPDRVVAEFDRAFESRMLDLIMRDERNQAIDSFRVVKHNSSITRYRDLLKKYQRAAKDATIAMIARDYPDLKTGVGLTPEENRMLGEIKDYIVKPSNCRSIRQFLIDNAPLVERTKRCLLMTPSSVAQFLPMDVTPFDMVIFDEASQLETCDAVGVIARGKQVIVTGDPKQMPPYDKIGSTKSDESTEMDSVLDECNARGLPSVKLAWHYRSRHESLISFSNHKYYEDNLNTFPSVNESKAVGVQYRFVPDGVFYSPSKGDANAEGEIRQIKGANIYEALRVVEYVIEAAKSFEFQSELRNSDEDPVIGVVAFNQTQQELITRLLKGRAPAFLYQKRSDGRASDVAADGKSGKKPVAYFVKNIESVQGDEADVIVFSICYGPYLPRREIESKRGTIEYKKFFPSGFGTLNTEGGEKRLNVAITRARVRMVVFASILSEEVAVADEKKKGPLHFKEFLAVAERSAKRMLGDSVAKPADGLVKIVADTLTANGYDYVAMVGASKCKIDLAVCDKYDKHRFMLGIECDGPMYRDQPLVMDRDVSRTEVLKGAQWEMYRVWSAEWLQGFPDCEDAKRRLLTKLAELTEASRRRRQNRWQEICKCKDLEAKEIEDFSVGSHDEEDLLAEVADDMEDNEEES